MEQSFSSSKVTIEYYDPHDVYKLIAPGLVPRLPLRSLNWKSHVGPLRSIDTLHVEFVQAGAESKFGAAAAGSATGPPDPAAQVTRNDALQVPQLGLRPSSLDQAEATAAVTRQTAKTQRHQIPGLRKTPYLKILFVRIDDNESYKSSVRAEIKDWIKNHTNAKESSKTASKQEKHDAFEYLIVHVVIPNSVASTQPRLSKSDSAGGEKATTSLFKSSSTGIWEKLHADFNTKSSSVDHVAQIRIGVNDVPYELLPRVTPAVPTGHVDTPEDSMQAWQDLLDKLRSLILLSFDMRVTQYEEDIREKASQRPLPGWNFCTFFMLKEGLGRGFESVGLVEDALVVYDELTAGLDSVIEGQTMSESPGGDNGGMLLPFTQDLKKEAQKALAAISRSKSSNIEVVDMSSEKPDHTNASPISASTTAEVPISSTKKVYRDLILANNVSVFDFRCYIFARQVSLLLRMGNAWSSREELLAKLREQQDSILYGVAPVLPPPQHEDAENLTVLAEVCRRTLDFIPTVSEVMRRDLMASMVHEMDSNGTPASTGHGEKVEPDDEAKTKIKSKQLKVPRLDADLVNIIDNMVASFAFSVAQQILAQTSTKAIPIPSSTTKAAQEGRQHKSLIPDSQSVVHSSRQTSLNLRSQAPSRSISGTGPHRPATPDPPKQTPPNVPILKQGLEELASKRGELYMLSRNILEERGKLRDWSGGWAHVPVLGTSGLDYLEEIDLLHDNDNDDDNNGNLLQRHRGFARGSNVVRSFAAGLNNHLLQTALQSEEDFYRLFETLTDKALRHFTVSNHSNSVQANLADLAVLKFHLKDYEKAAAYFYQATPFFGQHSWSLLELSMLCMYATCLKHLTKHDDYIRAVLKLLSKAAAAERDRLEQRSSLGMGPRRRMTVPESRAVAGFLDELLRVAATANQDYRLPLANILYSLEVEGWPEYHRGKDSFSLRIRLRSLVPDDLPLDRARIRLFSPSREIWLENQHIIIKPGINTITLHSSEIVPGQYTIDRVYFYTHNLFLHFEKDAASTAHAQSKLLKNNQVALYQRVNALNISLNTSNIMQLDKHISVDMVVKSGWNQIHSCDIKMKAATGGLRLLLHDAQVVNSDVEFSKPPDNATFSFDEIARDSTVTVRFPITLETDPQHISIKVEAVFFTKNSSGGNTESGTDGPFVFAKTLQVSVGLALGVNVQDVFKHRALFSRFTVTSTSSSPLRLFDSELAESDICQAVGLPLWDDNGIDGPVMVFPNLPASLVYKVTRKPGRPITRGTQKTMHLRLTYSVLQEEIEHALEREVVAALQRRREMQGQTSPSFTPDDDEDLWQYTRPIVTRILAHFNATVTPLDLERCAIAGKLALNFLIRPQSQWAKLFLGLGKTTVPLTGGADMDDDVIDAAGSIASFIVNWAKKTGAIDVPVPLWAGRKVNVQDGKTTSPPSTSSPCIREIIITVDTPSVSIVHTADIKLQDTPLVNGVAKNKWGSVKGGTTVMCTNQLIPAVLHLRWTRLWDTSGKPHEDTEFSYEVTAPADSWLVGGRKRGHFIIPGSTSETLEEEEEGSSADTSTKQQQTDQSKQSKNNEKVPDDEVAATGADDELAAPQDTSDEDKKIELVDKEADESPQSLDEVVNVNETISTAMNEPAAGVLPEATVDNNTESVKPTIATTAATKPGFFSRHAAESKQPLLESTVALEAHIPLLLAPLREGWLPFPHVEIRAVPTTIAHTQQLLHPSTAATAHANANAAAAAAASESFTTPTSGFQHYSGLPQDQLHQQNHTDPTATTVAGIGGLGTMAISSTMSATGMPTTLAALRSPRRDQDHGGGGGNTSSSNDVRGSKQAAQAALGHATAAGAEGAAGISGTALAGDDGVTGDIPFEVDLRNMGEMVRVVQDRGRVTLSLDSCGGAGGPLVLDCEGRGELQEGMAL